jgi:N-succinyldiaminopimelate aminotransferase
MKPINGAVSHFKESVFSTLTKLANKHQAINLAQGFPDFDGPAWVRDLAKVALDQNKNQYAPSSGTPSLRQAIVGHYRQFYDLSYDASEEVVVTNGATESLYCAITALINPGDEVVVFEPVYDSYVAALTLAQATIKVVTLHAPDFDYDLSTLRSVVTPETKLVILNNPHNPTGKVYTRAELTQLAALANEFDFYILSDEVYEFLTFEHSHIPIATIPGMKDRVITVSSIGKTLSLTGWKIGWACGPAELIRAIHHVHQFTTFCVAHPLQDAIAHTLPRLGDYLTEFRTLYARRRDTLVEGLRLMGFRVYKPQGTYFAVVRIPDGRQDIEYCQDLILNKKVATIPLSAFYLQSSEGRQLIRFCFAKKEETLIKAMENLKP